jgi:HAD superfamily hydrolase (TIGR01509 family)
LIITRRLGAVFAHFGYEVSFDDIRRQIGKGGDQIPPAFLPKDVVEKRGKDIDQYRHDLFVREFLPKVRAFPKVRELFERILADNLKIALASSAKGDELEQYKKRAHIEDLHDAETSSDDAEHSKPDPDIFLAACHHAGVRPEESRVVGDSPYDAEAARRAGSPVMGVLCAGFPEDWLRSAGCDAIYRNLADLLDRYEHSPIARPSGRM